MEPDTLASFRQGGGEEPGRLGTTGAGCLGLAGTSHLAVRVAPPCQSPTMIVHGDRDRTISPRYSKRVMANSRSRTADSGIVACLERRLAERLGGRDHYRLDGRLVLVRGEDHRCNGEAALRALLAAVEVLTFAS